MKELKMSRNTMDYERQFRVEGVRGDISLKQDKQREWDGEYWGLKSGAMLKASYSAEEIAHRERMNKMEPIRQAEIVLIDGRQYITKILGEYSDAVIFEPVHPEKHLEQVLYPNLHEAEEKQAKLEAEGNGELYYKELVIPEIQKNIRKYQNK